MCQRRPCHVHAHCLGNPEIAHPRRLALTMPPMGTALLGSHDLRLYTYVYIHTFLYMYIHVYIVCVSEYINSYTNLYVQFLNNPDHNFSCVFCVYGRFQVTGILY